MSENMIRLSQAIFEKDGICMTSDAWEFYQAFIAIIMMRLNSDLKGVRHGAIDIINHLPNIIDVWKTDPDEKIVTLDTMRFAAMTVFFLLCRLKKEHRDHDHRNQSRRNKNRGRHTCSKNRLNRH